MAHFLCTFLSNSPQCVWARFCLPRNVSILGYTLLLSSRTGSTILHKVCHSNNGRKLFCVVSDRRLSFCVTRFGEISPLWHNVKKLWPFWKSSFCIWKDLELTLANFICFGAIFQFCKCTNIKKNNRAIWSHWSRSSCIESSWVALRSFDSVKSVWPDWKIWRHLGEFLKSKVAKIYGEKNHFSTKNIAPWLCLCLPSCGPRFNSQAHSIRFFSMCT